MGILCQTLFYKKHNMTRFPRAPSKEGCEAIVYGDMIYIYQRRDPPLEKYERGIIDGSNTKKKIIK